MGQRIHRLDSIVANQIAAGEVVERPASVVKELVENSLDAGAQSIRIVVSEGGRARIRIQDDGSGMGPDDLTLSIERHATSKLTQLSDLDESLWLGFRGEALAAISAVSVTTISSKVADAPHGYRLRVHHGRPEPIEPVAMSVGTTVVVEDLFREVPARLKNLKSMAAELGAIQLVSERLAIGNPMVQFELVSEERTLFQTTGRGAADDAIRAIAGRDVYQHLLPVEYSGEDGLKIEGFVLPSHMHRGNRYGQSLYVNRRWVNNWVLRQAVEEAFRPNVPDRRYPWFWLWMTIDPRQCDPNAHPTKAEVRLSSERSLAARLFRAVKESLEASSTAAPLQIGRDESMVQSTFGTLEAPSSDDRQETDKVNELPLHEEFRQLVPLGQWHAKYIIAQGPQGLYLIDQHAAHERVFYEHFQRVGERIDTSQPLLMPWTRTLNPFEWDAWMAHRESLERVGFVVESLGGATVTIRAIPTGFGDGQVDFSLWQTVIDSLVEGSVQEGKHPVSWAENPRYAMAACKAAIKANRPLSVREMQHLFEQLAQSKDPRGCPHGRPTLLHLTLEEVDRRFGRH